MGLGVGSIVSVGGGTSSGAASGIQSINPGGSTGPTVTFEGVNGIEVTSPSTNIVLIDGAGASGAAGGVTKFAADFVSITSGLFTHNLGTSDILVQVYNRQTPRSVMILPDAIIIENSNEISVLYNRPQTGRIVIIG